MSNTRSILIRGVSCAYDSTSINKQRVLWYIQKDANNYTQLYLDSTTKTFNYQKCIGGVVTTLTSNAETFLKYQVFNILCQQTSTGIEMSILKNTGTYETYSNASVTYFEGSSSLYPLTKQTIGSEADAFLDSIVYMPSQVWDDTQAETILRGTKKGFEFAEMLNTTLSTTQTIKVYPNNQYQLKTTASTTITEMYNNIVLKTTTVSADTVFTTQSKTNNIKFDITGSFGLLSFKLKM